MKKLLSVLLCITFFSVFLDISYADEKQIYGSVLKIRTYEFNATNNTYNLTSIGSAVAIGNGLLLTNAHVVFNSDTGVPDGFYEVCRTTNFRKKAVCFTTGELLAYDEENDLALVKFRQPSDLPVAPLFLEDKINIGAPIFVYGYPGIGGENISRVQGNIAGYEEPYYKIDGAIDHGNSGGGAFNKYGQLLGIPTRVKSDNAVLGFMVPITIIRDFIAKKSKGYTPITLKTPSTFQKFIKDVQAGERSSDIINDLNIKTASLKKAGLSFLGKMEGGGLFLYGMKLSNLGESTLFFSCFRLGGSLTLSELNARLAEDTLKKYTTKSYTFGQNDRYVVQSLESLIATDSQDLINVYDTQNTCAATIKNVNLKKDTKIIHQAMKFITTGMTLKSPRMQTKGFDTQLFHIDALPIGITIKESVAEGSSTAVDIGYFGPKSNTGEDLEELVQKKRDTIDGYFLGGNSYFDDSPSDVNLKPSEYSYETLRKLYEKKYMEKGFSNTHFTIEVTKNKKKYILGTTEYRSITNKDDPLIGAIIFTYPYVLNVGEKKEYRELSFLMRYKGGNDLAINALKEFFRNFEPVGTAPF